VSQSSSIIASAAFDKVIVWDITTGNEVRTITGFLNRIEAIEFGSSKTDEILSRGTLDADSKGPQFICVAARDNTIHIFNIEEGTELISLQGHGNWVRDLTFHPNGKFLISVSDDRSVRVWDLSKRRCHYTKDNAHDLFISTCSWNPSLPLFATGGADKLKVWDCS